MEISKYKFNIPIPDKENMEISLSEGNPVFVLGANGVGKSALMLRVYSQNTNHSKRILAHRQNWFNNDYLNVTTFSKIETENLIRNIDSGVESRYSDKTSNEKPNITIFNLIDSETIRARKITYAVDSKNEELVKKASTITSIIHEINEIFKISNIPITIVLEDNGQLYVSKNGSAQYSISELSDGERNALLICSDVLTSLPNQLIIIDEPERHLHRSIISPLLTTLFQKRKDCAFVVSTHDVNLPIDHPDSSTLLLRGCNWKNSNIESWDADLIEKSDEIPDSIKHEIFGSKRIILFVEGESKSLDKQLYELIYPNVTVKQSGNCSQVEKSVVGLRDSTGLHWLKSFGLIDRDDRTKKQIDDLFEKGIITINCFSVESLYYNLFIIKKIAKILSQNISDRSEEELYKIATSKIIENIKPSKEKLCAKLCEKKVRNLVLSDLPDFKYIMGNDEFIFNHNLKEIFEEEKIKFDEMIVEEKLDDLIARYPIRETPVIRGIVSGLGISKDYYESAVRKLIVNDSEVKSFYKNQLEKVTNLIDTLKNTD